MMVLRSDKILFIKVISVLLASVPILIFIRIVIYVNLFMRESHDITLLYILVIDILPAGFGVYLIGKKFEKHLSKVSELARNRPLVFVALVFGIPFVFGLLVNAYHQ